MGGEGKGNKKNKKAQKEQSQLTPEKVRKQSDSSKLRKIYKYSERLIKKFFF